MLATHSDALYRTLCDADALAAAEGPKWLARRLSTAEGIRALINDTHQCNDGFTNLSATGLGLMQPPPAQRNRFVVLVPPPLSPSCGAHAATAIAVLVPDGDDTAGFTALMRRVADGRARGAPGAPATLLRSAWPNAIAPLAADVGAAGQLWFDGSRKDAAPWASRYTESEALTRRAVAALTFDDEGEAAALLNRSRGHAQPLTLYGGVLADRERAPWWLEPPDGHAGAAALWGARGVPLVAFVTEDTPGQERARFRRREFVIIAVGVVAIAAATAASMLPEARCRTKSLEHASVFIGSFLVSPFWLLVSGVACGVMDHDPAYCFANDLVVGISVVCGFVGGCALLVGVCSYVKAEM